MLVNLNKIGVCAKRGTQSWVVAVPWAVKIIGEDVEPVNMLSKTVNIKAPEEAVVVRNDEGKAIVSFQCRSQFFEQQNLLVSAACFCKAVNIGMYLILFVFRASATIGS